jgi:predicted DNA-binding transcriptional regulator AlpA
MFVETVSSKEQLAVIIGCSLAKVEEHLKNENFPKPYKRVGNQYYPEWEVEKVIEYCTKNKIRFNADVAKKVYEKAADNYKRYALELRISYIRSLARRTKKYKGFKLICMNKQYSAYLYAYRIFDGKPRYVYVGSSVDFFRGSVDRYMKRKGLA